MAPSLTRETPVYTAFPVINEDLCTHCGKCARFCAFNALISTKRANVVMAELCHDCGGCALVCPSGAISYGRREIGRTGVSGVPGDPDFGDGILHTGEFSAEKIIEAVLEIPSDRPHRIIDAPPGCSCSAVQAAEGADFALIVTEPTPFALSDMKMVVEMLGNLKVPAGVFLNKAGENEGELLAYCESENLPLLEKLPLSRTYGKTIVEGGLLLREYPEAESLFRHLWQLIKGMGDK